MRAAAVGARPVGFVANLGWSRAPNGQTQKARAVLDLLGRTGRSVTVADVGEHPIRLLRLLRMSWRGDTIVVVLNRKGLWPALALVSVVRLIPGRHRSVLVVPVVGGWLPEQLHRRPLCRWLARRVDRFLVESPRLVEQLSSIGLSAHEFANFRRLPIDVGRVRSRPSEPLRLCFAGRIRADKGVVLSAELVQRLEAIGIPATLDLYGPVEDDDAHHSALAHPHVVHRGTYETPEEALELLSGYDLLVLPSSYPGECMPGVLVEAAFAALPAVVSDWRDLPSVVVDGDTGYVCPLDGFVEAAAARIGAGLAAGELASLSRQALERARRDFTEEAARADLIHQLAGLEGPSPHS